jgi:hypothetical protein
MPKLLTSTADPNSIILAAGKSGYKFSATRPERLGATEYTLATIVLDYTGSVSAFKAELEAMLKTVLESCRKSPRANNLLVRVLLFSSRFSGGTEEIHGFKPLADIDPASYVLPSPYGGTPLRDATYDSAVATNAYAKHLYDQDFAVNSIQVVVTDGDDNASATPPSKIKTAFAEGVKSEFLESNISILVALNAAYCQTELQDFNADAGFDHYIDVADASAGKIAKLAAFVSHSISSQSQALGSGGPSQNIAAVI